MEVFYYKPNFEGLNIIKTEDEQQKSFFYKGHPEFLIPDFFQGKADIWISFLEYLERKIGEEVYDQDGGEIISSEILHAEIGLTKCVYQALVTLKEDNDNEEINVEIEGYVVKEENDNTYFLATKVTIP